MNRRKILFFTTLFISIATIIIITTGSSVLTIALDKENTIPLGTFITWAGMISLPSTVYWGIKEMRKPSNKLNRIISGLLKFIMVLGILWVPISYLLAGNLSFSFSKKETFQGGQMAMKWFWYLSYGIGLGAIFTLLIYWISLLFQKRNTIAKDK